MSARLSADDARYRYGPRTSATPAPVEPGTVEEPGSGTTDRSRLGVGFVVVAGPSPWWGGERGDVTDWFVCAGVAWVALPIGALALGGRSSGFVWAGLMVLGAAIFAAPIISWWSTGRWLFGTSIPVVMPMRVLGALAATAGIFRTSAPLLPGLALFGVLAGLDAVLSLRAIGVWPSALSGCWWFARSAIHLGVVVGLVVAASVAGDDAWKVALRLYVLLWLTVGVILAVVVAVQRGDEMVERHRLADQQAVRERERRDRAHWIHDDMCAELRLVRVRLDSHVLDVDEVAAALGELDHRLRLRQLDEQMASGPVRLAELVQPFARMLQDRGIVLTDVPSYDNANVVLDRDTASLVRRAVSLTTSNSLQAGARRVGIRASVTDDGVVVEVEDDAGGFRLEQIPAGRGLDRLRQEVRSLEVHRTGAGAIVAVHIERPTEPGPRRFFGRSGGRP